MWRIAAPLVTALACLALASPAPAQDLAEGDDRAPRFLFASASSAPVQVDALSLPSLRNRVAVSFEGESVAKALKTLAERTGLRFVYSRDIVPVDRRVTLKAEDISVAAVLTEILLDAAVDVVFSPPGQVALVPRKEARNGEITGRVVDTVTRGPVAGARVEIVGSSLSTTTDESGGFRLSNIPPGVVSLQATALGYQSFVRTDVVVGTGRPATVVLSLARAPLALGGIAVGPGYFATAAETPTSTQRLNPEEIRRSPGAQEDVVRAVSLLPGVVPTPIHDNTLIVRGGAPFENLFIVDGVEVPNINHFAAQGSSGGAVSLVNLAFVREAEFSAGGFGASRGDRVGSVTSLELREGITDRHAGEVNLAATGFGAIVEGPVGRGSYFAGVRRSYLDLIFELAGEPFVARYWDANAKIVQRLGSRDVLSWTFVGATDNFDFNIETDDDRFDAAILATNVDQYFSGLTWSRSGRQSALEVTAGRVHYAYGTFQNDTLESRIFTNQSTEAENSLRLKYTHALPRGSTVEVGAVAKYNSRLRYDIDLPGDMRPDADGEPRPLDIDTSFTAFRAGAYAETTVQWTSRFSTTLGGRVDYYGHLSDAVRIAPRAAASFALGRASTLNLSGGRYWQTPSFISLVGDPSNAENLRPLRVDQGVIGIQTLPREELKLQLEAYYKRYASYPTRVWRPQAVLAPGTEHVQTDIVFGLEPLTSQGTGWSYGAELFLQKRLSTVPIYGSASLSLNRTRFKALDGISRVGAYDAPVVFNVAAGWRPNAAWDLGLRFRVASGRVTTPHITSGPLEGRLDFGRYNQGGRMPTFHTLDIRADRRWALGSLQLTTYLEIQDVYNRDRKSVV